MAYISCKKWFHAFTYDDKGLFFCLQIAGGIMNLECESVYPQEGLPWIISTSLVYHVRI